MAKLSKVSIGVTVSGDGQTATYTPPGSPYENAAAPNGGTIDALTAIGDVVLTLPAGAVGVIIVPPAGSAVVKYIKGSAGDNGIKIHSSKPTLIHFDPSTPDFIINASAVETVELQWL